jgi:hypothetical protein
MEKAIVIWIVGMLCGSALILFLLNGNPAMTGRWVCTDWQIINFQPECHVLTKQEATK